MMLKFDIRRVAAEAGLDPRTVKRVLETGEAPRSAATLEAICRALDALGFDEEAKRFEKAS